MYKARTYFSFTLQLTENIEFLSLKANYFSTGYEKQLTDFKVHSSRLNSNCYNMLTAGDRQTLTSNRKRFGESLTDENRSISDSP